MISRQSSGSDDIDALFSRYSQIVLGAAYRVLHDANEAEDVVQEVFLYLHQKGQLFDPSKGSIKTWIMQIAVSRALDRKIHLTRRAFLNRTELDCLRLPEHADLERHIEARLNRTHIEKAFSELTNPQRKTIEFFYFEGLDLRDISEELREPLANVRHHLYRGLQRLRKSSVLHNLHKQITK